MPAGKRNSKAANKILKTKNLSQKVVSILIIFRFIINILIQVQYIFSSINYLLSLL